MIKLVLSSKIKKDLKKIKHRPKVKNKFDSIIKKLQREEDLPLSTKDHNLTGSLKDYRDCHILPDLILVYRFEYIQQEKCLYLYRCSSHSEIF